MNPLKCQKYLLCLGNSYGIEQYLKSSHSPITFFFRNIHVQREPVEAKERAEDEDEDLSVLLLSIESVSRLAFMRHASGLHEYLTNTLGW